MSLHASIGRYVAGTSPIHRLDPRLKLIVTGTYMASCLLVRSAATFALAAMALALAVAAAHARPARLLAQARPILVLLVMTAVAMLFSTASGPALFEAGPVTVHAGGMEAAAVYSLRFLLLLLAGALLMLTTPPLEICDASGRLLAPLARLGAPVGELTLAIALALRLVPELVCDAADLAHAQESRAAGRMGRGPFARARALAPFAVPLFANALRRADRLGMALDARCYTGDGRRTGLRPMRIEARRDVPAAAVTAAYVAALLALRALGW